MTVLQGDLQGKLSRSLNSLYCALVRSILQYGSVVWEILIRPPVQTNLNAYSVNFCALLASLQVSLMNLTITLLLLKHFGYIPSLTVDVSLALSSSMIFYSTRSILPLYCPW
ncbi:Hypothetical protein CINCED_3A022712 [Cinara cedri]|uniref:Uncharacterized protein n=1 Tax=Cinara cedri TaxID=506608 RepID=A0A5E4N1M3_9HEMI|nr:Hypothetical protein CINCED_3A022712 [Cinara cedri]